MAAARNGKRAALPEIRQPQTEAVRGEGHGGGGEAPKGKPRSSQTAGRSLPVLIQMKNQASQV